MTDLYQQITDTVVEAIEHNPGEPVLPWYRKDSLSIPENVQTKAHYQGINILHLWAISLKRRFSSPFWGTYKQWQSVEAQVRKGERASQIVFYKQYETEGDDGEKETLRIMRWSFVFNADQVDGFEDQAIEGEAIDHLVGVDEYIANTGATIIHGGGQAFYSPARDAIQMPNEERFFDTETSTRTEGYYSTLLHELTHWTAHQKRLNRDLSGRFGSEAYAMEELVAELGAAFQCCKLGVTPEPRADHSQYLANWLKVLKSDKKAIFAASARAQEAVTYLEKFSAA